MPSTGHRVVEELLELLRVKLKNRRLTEWLRISVCVCAAEHSSYF